ncbi:MAG: class II fructose-bisphosphate aldolase [Verrucomicrobiae bacterium]|nr:class II fructose-bisphosphate aldolase [Verrucomicrobiae bacterium]
MLEKAQNLIRKAQAGRYALGYFESWDLESLQGVLDAAEKCQAPVIVGFNGEFLTRQGRALAERLPLYAAMGRAAAETTRASCALLFNECTNSHCLQAAVELGFNMIAVADGMNDHGQYTEKVTQLASFAHERGAAVEAELGELPCGASGSVDASGASSTNSGQAAAFVAITGIDLLAVSVGNVHIRLEGKGGLDLGRLEELRRNVPVPLVLHGGTGISDAALREAIAMGVVKVNYGTCLKQRYLAMLRLGLGCAISNPHALLGMGGEEDLKVITRKAVRDVMLEQIESLGCCGKA